MLLFLSFWTCKKNVVRIPEHTAVYDLASPIQLGYDTTRVYLTDYFLYPVFISKHGEKIWTFRTNLPISFQYHRHTCLLYTSRCV